jgi:predicted DNA-binding transcriptional regulator AlpA
LQREIAQKTLEIVMTGNFTIPAFEKVNTPRETAARLKVSESFLAKKRVSGGGPRFIKIGRLVRYPESAISEYLASQVRTSTSDVVQTHKSRSEKDEGHTKSGPAKLADGKHQV